LNRLRAGHDLNQDFSSHESSTILATVSTVKEIEAAIPKLSRAEVEEIREWIEDYLDDQMELTDDVKSKLDQSRQEIAAGQFTTRQPN